ncbi:hypothetical protein B0H14DRAFT_3480171 [Mycena olivaceomarginata]|nr:hypothetical protein B0H14DRAFT_3480171 [Mycena olivaceomarginata]
MTSDSLTGLVAHIPSHKQYTLRPPRISPPPSPHQLPIAFPPTILSLPATEYEYVEEVPAHYPCTPN